jgi:hypothetical protein
VKAGATGEYRLSVGDAVVALHNPESELIAAMTKYFEAASAQAAPHVRLELELFEAPANQAVPSSLFVTKEPHPDGGFVAAGGLLLGDYDPESGRGTLRTGNVLVSGRNARVFEQILYQAYYSAVRRGAGGGTLLHAAAVVRDGAGFLFAGSSGSGKTTLARLCAQHTVLNDEIALVQARGGGHPWVVSTPFNGFFREKKPGAAPLRAVFLLEHGEDHRVVDPGPAAAAAALTAQLVPPIGLEDFMSQATTAAMFDRALATAERVPTATLRFRPDANFWSAIDDYLLRGR